MKKIMVVDDEPDILLILEIILQKEGFGVTTIKSGQECLDKLEKERPDLILMDIMMLGLDGWETCKKIKENDKTKSIPVLTLTVRTSDDSTEKSFKYAHADGHIGKPIDKKELLDKINKALKGR